MDDTDGEGVSDPTRVTGALYSVYAPKIRASKLPGEWNRSRIVVRGDTVEHWLNGKEVLRYELGEPKVVELLHHLRKADDAVRASPIRCRITGLRCGSAICEFGDYNRDPWGSR